MFKMECSDCYGEGLIECGNCGGDGEHYCWECGTDHECGWCSGEGEYPCETCKGKGSVPLAGLGEPPDLTEVICSCGRPAQAIVRKREVCPLCEAEMVLRRMADNVQG